MPAEMTLGDAVVNIMGNISPLQQAFVQSQMLTSSFLAGVQRSMLQFVGRLAVPIAAGLSIKSVMSEWMGKEVVINNLATALQAAGDQVDLYLPRLKAFAEEIQSISTYSSEAVMSTMAHAKSLGIEASQMEEVTLAAIGLSAKIGIGLGGAMQLLIRASHGSTQRLKMYGIVLDENATKQEKFRQLLKIGTDAMPLAEGKVKTLSGQLTIMRNIWSDLRASIGQGLAEPLKANMDAMQKQISAWGVMMERIREQGNFAGISAAVSGVLSTIWTAIATVARAFWSLSTLILSPLENIVRGLISLFILLTGAIEKAIGLRPNQSWDALLKSAADVASGQWIKPYNPVPDMIRDWAAQATFLNLSAMGFGDLGIKRPAGAKTPMQEALEGKAGEVFSFAEAWTRLQKEASKKEQQDALDKIVKNTADTVNALNKSEASPLGQQDDPPPLSGPGSAGFIPGSTSEYVANTQATTTMFKNLRKIF